jgi:uracil-DNA glycosylase
MATREDLELQLREHLKFYAELGVDGFRADAGWRQRADHDPSRSMLVSASPSDDEPAPEPDEAPIQNAPPPADPEAAPRETLDAIRLEIGPDCSRCKLHGLGRKTVVFGVGNPNADLMFVGEAPGHDEDVQGIPFVGRAGQLLTRIIEAINLTREDVYIANVIKCRPPENRNPEPDEVDACEPFLFRQVQVIRPRIIVALGTFAARALLRSKDPISRMRGQIFKYGDALLIPTFHPAYVLRNPASKRDVWEDMKKVRDLLAAGTPRSE